MKQINYQIRPKKAAERIMLCQAMQRVHLFSNIKQYQYIGFGALYFVDYKLFHKELGINSMFSIEKDRCKTKRYQFNIPYDFVTLVTGTSKEVLPKLDLSKKSLVWLDYTSRLNSDYLSDIAVLVDKLPIYSVILITLNHQVSNRISEDEAFRELERELGASRLGKESVNDICTERLPDIYRNVIKAEVSDTLKYRNSIDLNKADFQEICALRYRDQANMMTYGFVLTPYRKKTEVKSAFKGLPYMLTKDFYNIDFPMMTMKEQLMFTAEKNKMKRKKLFSSEELKLFYKHYQYMPIYTEVVL